MDTTQPSLNSGKTDHDLLIELSADLRNLNYNINTFNATSVNSLSDHEKRIRDVEYDVKGLTSSKKGSSVTIANIYTILATIASMVVAVVYIISLFKK